MARRLSRAHCPQKYWVRPASTLLTHSIGGSSPAADTPHRAQLTMAMC